MTTAKAEWIGTIEVGRHLLDCRLFSTTRRRPALDLVTIHKDCQTIIDEEKETRPPEDIEEREIEKPMPAPVAEQLFCGKCRRSLHEDEIGRAIRTEKELVRIAESEIEKLKFEPTKRIAAELYSAKDPVLESVRASKRFYVMPRPAAVDPYSHIYFLLSRSQAVGFIPLLVLRKKPHSGILRPLQIQSNHFGRLRKVLVVDILHDFDSLRYPTEFSDYPNLPDEANNRVKNEAAEIKTNIKNLRFRASLLVDPRRQKLKELIKLAVAKH